MTKLEELINELCPNGVEYVQLSKVAEVYDGTHKTPTYTNEGVKFVSVENIYSLNSSKKCISFDDYKQYKIKPQQGDILMTRIGDVGRTTVITNNDPLAYYVSLALIRPSEQILSYYLKHYIESSLFKKELYKRTLHTAVPLKINLGEIGKCEIKIPPLSVQHEIVRILDKFTQLIEELTRELVTELRARKKQYEYYRNKLLSNKAEWLTLGEVGRVAMCKRIMKAETSSEGDVPFFKIGTFGKKPDAYITQSKFEKYKNNYPFPKKGDILISAAGTIGRTVVYNGEPAYYQDSNIVWIANDESKILNRYLFYCYQLKPWAISEGGTIARLYNDNISRTKIPVPPLAEQARIVAILDRFEALTTDISEGLPAEIEARRKQYEYYRNKLLTFKEEVL